MYLAVAPSANSSLAAYEEYAKPRRRLLSALLTLSGDTRTRGLSAAPTGHGDQPINFRDPFRKRRKGAARCDEIGHAASIRWGKGACRSRERLR